jgi:hypothetical protein
VNFGEGIGDWDFRRQLGPAEDEDEDEEAEAKAL